MDQINFSVFTKIDDNENAPEKGQYALHVVTTLIIFFVIFLVIIKTPLHEEYPLSFIIFIPGVIYLLKLAIEKAKAVKDKEFLQKKEFADNNNFLYSDTVPEEFKKTHFFSLGNSNKAYDYFLINKSENLFSIFDFNYVEKIERGNQHETKYYPFICIVLHLEKNVPNIYIQNKQNSNIIINTYNEEQLVRLKIDLDFENNHKIYTPKGTEIEALQLLDSRYISFVSETIPTADVEFIENKMFIYLPYEITDYNYGDFQLKFKEAYSVGEKMSSKIKNILSNFSFTPAPSQKVTLDTQMITFNRKETIIEI